MTSRDGSASLEAMKRAWARLFPTSLGAADLRRNWKAWTTVGAYPGRVTGVPEIFGWMVLHAHAIPQCDLTGWSVRPAIADGGGLVVVEATDQEAWFENLPPDDAVIRAAQRQFADVLWGRDQGIH